jgi:hypothetical protein
LDKTVPDQVDITLVDRTNKKAAFNDKAIPLTHNLQATIKEATQISGIGV